jgi:putative ABC transport system permease protein
LPRSPAFAVTVVAALALGIGASLTMLGLLRAVLWRPLPYPEPDRIVTIQVDARDRPNTGATPSEVLDLKARSRSFEQVSMIDSGDANLEYQGGMERVSMANVSDGFLPLLGARPSLGRTLDSRIDHGREQAFAILISDELWRRRFAGDPRVIGRAVRINGAGMRIVGVLPPGFRLFLPPSAIASGHIDAWLPYALSTTRRYRGIPVTARLRPGVSLGQANAELLELAA